MNPFEALFITIVAVLIMSYGTGLVMGGEPMAERIIAWELKMLAKIGRSVLKLVLRLIADLCHWAHGKL